MNTLTIRGKSYRFDTVTGAVLNANKNLETSINASGSGKSGVNVTSTTIVHDQFFLEDNNGREHSYQLKNFNVACRAGNTLSVITAFKDNQANGHYVAVINQTTGKMFFGSEGLYRTGMPNLLMISGIYIAIFIIGCMTSGSHFIGPALLTFFAFMGYFLFVMFINARAIKNAIIRTDFKIQSNEKSNIINADVSGPFYGLQQKGANI